jgi:phage gpG-like protein
MTEVTGLREFLKKMDAVADVYNRIPNEVAIIAVNFTKERFRDQAWLDKTREPWKERSKKRPGKKRSQTLLVDKGRLKRSIRKVLVTQSLIVIGTDVRYAQALNDGFKGTINQRVKAHERAKTKFGIASRKSFKRSTRIEYGRVRVGTIKVKAFTRKIRQNIPARPFIGASETLERRIFMHIYYRFEEVLNK